MNQDNPPPIDPLEDLTKSCFRLLGTLQNIERESEAWHKDFQESMQNMSLAMNKFIR